VKGVEDLQGCFGGRRFWQRRRKEEEERICEVKKEIHKIA
jgi:hypothetical protein